MPVFHCYGIHCRIIISSIGFHDILPRLDIPEEKDAIIEGIGSIRLKHITAHILERYLSAEDSSALVSRTAMIRYSRELMLAIRIAEHAAYRTIRKRLIQEILHKRFCEIKRLTIAVVHIQQAIERRSIIVHLALRDRTGHTQVAEHTIAV